MRREEQAKLIGDIIQAVLCERGQHPQPEKCAAFRTEVSKTKAAPPPLPPPDCRPILQTDTVVGADGSMQDIRSATAKAQVLVQNAEDGDALLRMKARTNARIAAGRCGLRLNTRSLLTLRADHAAARDAVFKDVSEEILKAFNLFSVQTMCQTKDEYLTRPDLGRVLSPEGVQEVSSKCKHDVDVQIFASDGLSSTSIDANLAQILPILTDALCAKGLSVGTPFFVRYGRVGTMDHVSEILNPTVCCVLIGERPGLATAESMSAYIAYKATVGMPEARRTVVSNIHSQGINAVEAGAYIADVIENILQKKASGVELKK